MDDPTARERRDLRLLGAVARHDDAGHGQAITRQLFSPLGTTCQ
jgi:hypothetical protein